MAEESSNSLGLVVVRTTTAPAGADEGGWVKVRTNKGRMLLEKMQAAHSARRMSVSQSDIMRAHSQGIELVQEELIDLVISGSGPLGLRFAYAKGLNPDTPNVRIEVKHIVPGSIASAIADLEVGQILRMVDGEAVGSYNQSMTLIGQHWRAQDQMTLSLVNPAAASEDDDDDDANDDDDADANGVVVEDAAEDDEDEDEDDDEDDVDTPLPAPARPHEDSARIGNISGRRASVAEAGISEVGALAESIAAELGTVAEKVFMVNQEHVKKARPLCELKVGGMGLVLLDGPKVLETYRYQSFKSWMYGASGVTLFVKPTGGRKTGVEIFFGTSDGQAICELMTAHALAMRAIKKTASEDQEEHEAEKVTVDSVPVDVDWKSVVREPTLFMLCNPDGTKKHERWFRCKPNSGRITWSPGEKGSGKTGTVKSVSLGFGEDVSESHSALGFTIVTTDGNDIPYEIHVIASDSAQRRLWTGACQMMLEQDEQMMLARRRIDAFEDAACSYLVEFDGSSTDQSMRESGLLFAVLDALVDDHDKTPDEWLPELEAMNAGGTLTDFVASCKDGLPSSDEEEEADEPPASPPARQRKYTSEANQPKSMAVKYKVLAKCTVREGKEGDSA